MEGDSPPGRLPWEGIDGSRGDSPLGPLPWEGLGGRGNSPPGRLPWQGVGDAISRCCMVELSREELSNSISELKREVDYLLNEKPLLKEKLQAPAHRSSKAPPRHQKLPALAESRKDSRRASSSSSAATGDGVPLFRRCACGCGEMVLTGGGEWDTTIAPLAHRSRSLQVLADAPDARAQRESCERLTRRRERPPAAGADAEAADAEAAPRRPDLDRLRQMARPRERAPEPGRGPPQPGPRKPRPPPPHGEASEHAGAGAGRAPSKESEPGGGGPGSRAPSKGRSAAAPEPAAAGGAPGARPRPADQERAVEAAKPPEPAPSGPPPPPPPEAPSGHQRPQLRRSLCSSSMSELPGMHRLLERRGTVLRPLSPLAEAAAPDGPSAGCLLADEVYPRRRAQRTAQSQKQYTEARLYRPGGPAPGSAAALQLRLESLRAERREREAAVAAVH